jgi:hypothetical protein
MLASFYSMLFLNTCRRPITLIKKRTEYIETYLSNYEKITKFANLSYDVLLSK